MLYREVTASVTFNNDYNTIREIWDATDAVYNALPSKDKVDWMVSFIPQAQIQQTYAAKRGGNSLGLTDVPDQIGKSTSIDLVIRTSNFPMQLFG